MSGLCTGIVDPYWHQCYWKSEGCEQWEAQNKKSIDFYKWLKCYEAKSDGCTDSNGAFYACYLNNTCVGIVAPTWHGCYWDKVGCRRNLKDEEEELNPDVRFISMKLFNGRYEGLRLYDEDKNYISDLVWS